MIWYIFFTGVYCAICWVVVWIAERDDVRMKITKPDAWAGLRVATAPLLLPCLSFWILFVLLGMTLEKSAENQTTE
jgi:hypothetical protein